LDHPVRADGLGEHARVEAVLKRDHVAVAGQAADERGRDRLGVMSLDGDEHRAVKLGWQVSGADRLRLRRELLDRAGDLDPGRVDRGDNVRIRVCHKDFVAITRQASGHSAAYRTTSHHHVTHGSERYNTVTPSV